MFKFSRLEMRQENIYDVAGEVLQSNTLNPKIIGSSIKAYAHFQTGLASYHEIPVILSQEEIEKIAKICNEAAFRTAGAISACAVEAEELGKADSNTNLPNCPA